MSISKVENGEKKQQDVYHCDISHLEMFQRLEEIQIAGANKNDLPQSDKGSINTLDG